MVVVGDTNWNLGGGGGRSSLQSVSSILTNAVIPPSAIPTLPSGQISVSPLFTGSYEAGTWVITTSSLYGGSPENNILSAFDYNSATYYTIASNYYTGALNAYAGPATTTLASGSKLAGEWLQVMVPTAFIISSYLITTRPGAIMRIPSEIYLLAYTNNNTWVQLDYHLNTTLQITKTFTLQILPTTAYTTYRVVVTKTSGDSWLSIATFSMFASTFTVFDDAVAAGGGGGGGASCCGYVGFNNGGGGGGLVGASSQNAAVGGLGGSQTTGGTNNGLGSKYVGGSLASGYGAGE